MLGLSFYLLAKIIVYLLILIFARSVFWKIVRKFFSHAKSLAKVQKKRIDTLESLFVNIASYSIYAIVFLMLLRDLGVDTTPIITGAGILGLAFSFGSQSLVKDLISGIFILLENQFNVGDKVEIEGVKGKVKKMNLRTTVLEDEEGNIVFIPNSKISKVKVIRG